MLWWDYWGGGAAAEPRHAEKLGDDGVMDGGVMA